MLFLKNLRNVKGFGGEVEKFISKVILGVLSQDNDNMNVKER